MGTEEKNPAILYGGLLYYLALLLNPIGWIVVWLRFGIVPFVVVAAIGGAIFVWLVVRRFNNAAEQFRVKSPSPTPDAAADSK